MKWTKWEGGERPVDGEVEVVVRQRNGAIEDGQAGFFNWGETISIDARIIEYAVIDDKPDIEEIKTHVVGFLKWYMGSSIQQKGAMKLFDRWQESLKPKTIMIGDIEVPAPEAEPLECGQKYFIPSLTIRELTWVRKWNGDDTDFRRLKRRRIHLTNEAAKAHAKAEIIASGGKIDD